MTDWAHCPSLSLRSPGQASTTCNWSSPSEESRGAKSQDCYRMTVMLWKMWRRRNKNCWCDQSSPAGAGAQQVTSSSREHRGEFDRAEIQRYIVKESRAYKVLYLISIVFIILFIELRCTRRMEKGAEKTECVVFVRTPGPGSPWFLDRD